MAALLFVGGTYCIMPASAAEEKKQESVPPAAVKLPVEKNTATKPPSKEPEKPSEKKPAKKPVEELFDSFHLPLIIRLVPPEVPSEIQKPSPPIKENSEPPKKSIWKYFFGRNYWLSANGLFV